MAMRIRFISVRGPEPRMRMRMSTGFLVTVVGTNRRVLQFEDGVPSAAIRLNTIRLSK